MFFLVVVVVVFWGVGGEERVDTSHFILVFFLQCNKGIYIYRFTKTAPSSWMCRFLYVVQRRNLHENHRVTPLAVSWLGAHPLRELFDRIGCDEHQISGEFTIYSCCSLLTHVRTMYFFLRILLLFFCILGGIRWTKRRISRGITNCFLPLIALSHRTAFIVLLSCTPGLRRTWKRAHGEYLGSFQN